MRKLILLALLISTIGHGQMSESERQEIGDVNLIENAGAENGLQRWTNAGGGTFAIEDGANVAVGTRSFSWDASAASDTLTSKQATIPPGLQGRFCYASFLYKGGDSNLTAQVIDGSLSVLASQALSAQTGFALGELGFTCPSSGTVAFRLSAGADAAIVYLDQVFVGIRSQNLTYSVSPTVYELSKSAVGSVGNAGQIKAGHVLTDESFRTYTTDISYYNLGDNQDDSTNARNLTNNGAIAFTGTDIFGAVGIADFDGIDDYFDSSDTFFDPTGDFVVGGWFNANNWGVGNQGLFSKYIDASRGYLFRLSGSLGLGIFTSTTGTDLIGSYYEEASNFTGWHHLAFRYSASNETVELIADGLLVLTHYVGGTIFNSTNGFAIGTQFIVSASNFFNGQIQDVFYVDGTLSDAEIKRIYAAKITHNKNVPVQDQSWSGTFWDSSDDLIAELDQDWLVHKTANSVYLDLALAGSASLKLQNQSISSTNIPVKTYTTGLLSSAPTFPLNHGLPCVPQDFYVRTEGQSLAGQFDKRYDLLSVTGSEINGDVSSLTIDGSHRLEIVASCAPIAVSLPVADATTVGTMSTSAQSFGGDKTFSGTTTVNNLTITGTTTGLPAASDSGAGTVNFYKSEIHSTTWTYDGGTGTSASTDIIFTRVGNLVTITLKDSAIASVTGGTPTSYSIDSAFPADYRPAQIVQFVLRVQNNSTKVAALGQITSTGGITVFPTIDGGNFSGVSGISDPSFLGSYVVD